MDKPRHLPEDAFPLATSRILDQLVYFEFPVLQPIRCVQDHSLFIEVDLLHPTMQFLVLQS
jgi:hypothetical protein